MPVQSKNLDLVAIVSRIFAANSLYHYACKIDYAPGNMGAMETRNGEEGSSKEIIPKGIATQPKTGMDQVCPFVCLTPKEYHSTQNGQQQKVSHPLYIALPDC